MKTTQSYDIQIVKDLRNMLTVLNTESPYDVIILERIVEDWVLTFQKQLTDFLFMVILPWL